MLNEAFSVIFKHCGYLVTQGFFEEKSSSSKSFFSRLLCLFIFSHRKHSENFNFVKRVEPSVVNVGREGWKFGRWRDLHLLGKFHNKATFALKKLFWAASAAEKGVCLADNVTFVQLLRNLSHWWKNSVLGIQLRALFVTQMSGNDLRNFSAFHFSFARNTHTLSRL